MDLHPPRRLGAPARGPVPAQAGIGLRLPHHELFLAGRPPVAWLEAHAENCFGFGAACEELAQIRRDYPLSLHAVGLSLGSADGLDHGHLDSLADLARRLEPGLVSDHLSWSAIDGVRLPDLLPLPYTEEALEVFVRNLDRAQTVLQRPLLIENPSAYLRFAGSSLSEAEFLAELVARTGCGVLLDINNVFVSAMNLGGSPGGDLAALLDRIPAAAIGEVHLAGHAVRPLAGGGELRIDDHGSLVCDEVWRLFEIAVGWIGPRPTLIEWDTGVPPLAVLLAEAAKAQVILDDAEEPRRAAFG